MGCEALRCPDSWRRHPAGLRCLVKLVEALVVAVLDDPKGCVSFLVRISILILKSCWIFAITAFWRSMVVVSVLMVEDSS